MVDIAISRSFGIRMDALMASSNTFLKTVSALSKYHGGAILFGVDDDGNVKGLPDVKQACLDIENKINDSISPNQTICLKHRIMTRRKNSL